jgi:hypothetical protein
VDEAYPRRSHQDDGTIRDANHATRSAGHDPHVPGEAFGIGTAPDMTHDPAAGCDAGRIATALRGGRDVRIKSVVGSDASPSPPSSTARLRRCRTLPCCAPSISIASTTAARLLAARVMSRGAGRGSCREGFPNQEEAAGSLAAGGPCRRVPPLRRRPDFETTDGHS